MKLPHFWIAIPLLLAFLTGCAGSVLSHAPYALKAGTVIESSPQRVVTEWSHDNWYWNGASFGGNYLISGNLRTNVCPSTVPDIGLKFNKASLAWDKAAKCWRWQSQ